MASDYIFTRQIKEGRDINNAVILRSWEFALYSSIDNVFANLKTLISKLEINKKCQTLRQKTINSILMLIYGKRITALGEVIPNCEYYLINGKIKIQKYAGFGGCYKTIKGKNVRISGRFETAPTDEFTFFPWKEANSGQFDEDLGAPVGSKQEYRRLMKEKGLVPLESSRYCGSNEYRRKQREKYEAEKNRPKIERAFVEACQRHGGGLNDN